METIMILTQSLNGGGAEKSAAYLSLGLSKYYNVILVSINHGSVVYDYGGKLIRLNIKSKKYPLGKIFNLIHKTHRIKKLKLKYSPDVVISFLELPNLINVMTKKQERVFTSIRNITSSEQRNRTKLYKMLIRYMVRKSDRVVSLSDYAKIDLINFYRIKEEKIITINNICDLGNIDKWTKLDDNKYGEYIVSVGRLSSEKGQWHLIRAFKKIHREYSDYKLVLVGDGYLRDKYEQIIQELDLAQSVILTGWQTNPYDIVYNAQLFVFTSIYEGFGNVLLEALALSKAIVASDSIGGANEILCPEYVNENKSIDGIIPASWAVMTPKLDLNNFDSSTPLTSAEEFLADAVISLIKDDHLKRNYESRAYRRASEYRPEVILPKWIDIISNKK